MARVLEYTKITGCWGIDHQKLSPRAEILDVTIVSYLIDSGSGWWDTNRIDQLFLPFEAQKIGPYHCG